MIDSINEFRTVIYSYIVGYLQEKVTHLYRSGNDAKTSPESETSNELSTRSYISL